jgi:chlorobactene glucosyltransferase
MTIVLALVMGFLGIRAAVSAINLVTFPALRPWGLKQYPALSILVPARNEAANLPHLLSLLEQLAYPGFEAWILDDQSEDETPEILAEAAARLPWLHVIQGAPLPDGWLGKNWACHQLAQAAGGDYFLFLDADIAGIHPGLPEAAIADMKRRELSLLSIFPDQQMQSLGERMVVPLMHYVLLSLLPLWWILRFRFPSMAAANGQFMLFDAAQYRARRWHEQVKRVIVEDIAIMREVKRAGLRGMTYVANGMISCRMYQSGLEAASGFSKNLLAGFGNSIPGLLICLALLLASAPLAVLFFPGEGVLGVVLLILFIRLSISIVSRQSPLWNLWLHPIQMTALFWIGMASIYRKLTGKNVWKGRNVQL